MKMKRLLYWLIVFPLLASILLLPATPVRAQGTEILRPSDNGTNTKWEAFGATNNWECVDEVTSDNDTTYVYTSANNEHNSYNLQDHATESGTITNVRVYARAKSITPGKTFAIEVVIGGTTRTGATKTLTDAYVDYFEDWAQNPATAADWAWSDIDALEAGVRNFLAKNVEHRVTTVWVVVTYTLLPDISNTPSEWNLGVVSEGSTSATGLTYFEVTNNSGYAVNIDISAGDMTGGDTWLLADSGIPDATHYALEAGTPGLGDYTLTVTSTGIRLVSSLAGSGGTQQWGLQLLVPTSFSDGATKSGTVTLTATQS